MSDKIDRKAPGGDDFARKIKAQAVSHKPLARRFYASVETEQAAEQWRVALDGRPVRAPTKNVLELPTEALANAVAKEWEAQEEHIEPATMPFTKLCNTAVGRVEPERARVIDEIVSYANSDLLCYRAEQPAGLVVRQVRTWDPLLDEFRKTYGAGFTKLAGVMHTDQPPVTLDAVRSAIEALTSFQITGLHNGMTLTGSAVIALALTNAPARVADLWSAAHVDEDWQIELWGDDAEETARRALREADFHKTAEFLSLLG